jgi:medium-chain acyl-[acyl-carrier-protein] hydrolase
VRYFQAMDWIEFVTVQLPGRGRRLGEAPYDSLEPLMAAVQQGLEPLLDRPYVLFGFSMGAILAFELALRQQQAQHRRPAALILAGRGAPRTATGGAAWRFSRENPARAGAAGRHPALLADGPFMEVFMRTFQADFMVADGHHCPGADAAMPAACLGRR